MLSRRRIRVQGVVQGVGFRPFVHQLATAYELAGHVFNSAAGVVSEAEGTEPALDRMARALREELPPLARIDALEIVDLEPRGDASFTILPSVDDGGFALVPPDASSCDACLAEVRDPRNRRFGYPFTNCTHCGPRYTIIRDVPYDRPRTTMSAFVMCDACQAEYDDPRDRRFHAQPNACPVCGPRLSMGEAIGDQRSAISGAQAALANGEILALKGLGGFQLVCEPAAEARLRERKRRSEKPFAMMMPDLATVERFHALSDAERAALQAPERPIVILTPKLAVMLPYTPLHYLLCDRPLIMTSGNLSEEPIAIDDAQLPPIAGRVLTHDREIHTRVDDSVVRVFEGKARLLRRARSYVPRPIGLGKQVPELLAVGAQLKNTFCLTKGSQALLSQHIGDLENYETLRFFEETLERMQRLFRVAPIAVAHDLHPAYMSTRLAEESGLPRIGVQHHHAHIASCMAENGLTGRVIGVAFDGTGYGTDGAVWGGEILTADLVSFRRRAHIRYVPLAGGDAAVRQPWRMALSHLRDALGHVPDSFVHDTKRRTVLAMIERGIQTVSTSSCGRLFDAVASIINLRHEVTFEGQAAMELEAIASPHEQPYPYEISATEPMQLDFRPMLAAIARDPGDRARVAGAFHETLAAAIEDVCLRIRADEALTRVCLSGGTFQNWLLLGKVVTRLRNRGFTVILHEQVPPNDGGISLGQAAVAAHRIEQGA